tara:strand:+ start:266 stop:508 length:243 start_codon:yes stop_codon:yes gene_type:complete
MDRKIETLFDLVPSPQTAALLDSSEIKDMCREQQSLTMQRIASWLRNNSKIFQLEWDYTIARELKDLADDLDHLASLKDV